MQQTKLTLLHYLSTHHPHHVAFVLFLNPLILFLFVDFSHHPTHKERLISLYHAFFALNISMQWNSYFWSHTESGFLLLVYPPSFHSREREAWLQNLSKRKKSKMGENSYNYIVSKQYKLYCMDAYAIQLERGSRHSQATSQLTKQWPNVIS